MTRRPDTDQNAERGWTRHGRWVLVALGLGLIALMIGSGEGASSSTLSRGGSGWWAAWSLVESMGVEAERLDVPLDEAELGDGVLVLAFPWQRGLGLGELDAVIAHLRAGGDVVVAYDAGRFVGADEALWSRLGSIGEEFLRDEPPLAPLAWWRFRHDRWTVPPAAGFESGSTLELAAFDSSPGVPLDATVLYATPAGARGGDMDGSSNLDQAPIVFAYRHLGGTVVGLPAHLLSNAELRRAGNADLVATLVGMLDGPWRFDEYHHGMTSQALAAEPTAGTVAWDTFILHLVLIYGLGVWWLSRPFGAPWREPAPHHGSTAGFLRRLGALHDRLGHHPKAARTLVRRATELDPKRVDENLPAEIERETQDPGFGPNALVRLAGRLDLRRGQVAGRR